MLRSKILLILFLSTSTLLAQVSFEQILPPPPAPQVFPKFAELREGSVAFADIDGNGTEDMLMTGRNTSNVLFSILYSNDGTGNFTEFSRESIKGLRKSSVAFSDVDGNGSQDLLIIGEISFDDPVAILYLNDGNGNFTEVINTPFEPVINSAIAFSDVDGNGSQDLLVTGINNVVNYVALLYLNDGSGSFTKATDIPFRGVSQGSIAFSDVDGNGTEDVLIIGYAGFVERSLTKLYTNDGSGNFTEVVETPFEDVSDGSIAFSDVDGNGTQDVLLSGLDGLGGSVTKLYANDGMGNFNEVAGVPFESSYYGSISFSDVDGNGSQDVLITGAGSSSGLIAKLYMNDGAGNFLERSGTPFEGVQQGSAVFSDVDGNGTQDLMIVGKNDAREFVSNLYLNDGAGIFSEVALGPFDPVYFSATAFSDVDGNGTQDVLNTGSGYNGPISKLYRNDGSGNFSEVPGTPFEGLANSSIAFSDIDANGTEDVLITGQNRLSRIYSILYQNDGTGNFTEVEGAPFAPVRNGSIAFADVNGNGSPDVLITGLTYGLENFEATAKLYRNDGSGNFSEVVGTPFQAVYNSAIAFADVDRNGAKDVMITGLSNSNQRVARMYFNDGSGNFTEQFGIPFEGVSSGAVAFADVDRNGTEDVLISGQSIMGEQITQLYTNDGAGNFIEVLGTPFEGVVNSAIAFADVDGNGSKDLLLSGVKRSDLYITKLYINDGAGNFTEAQDMPFEAVAAGTIKFADVDNDRKVDVLITGLNVTGRRISYLYRNTTDFTITSNTGKQKISNFILYPNPAGNHLTIKGAFSHEISGLIIDLNGKEIERFTLSSTKNQVDVSDLSKGMFILSFEYRGELVRERFVKK